MKLYLSSYHLGNNPQALADLIGKNKKIAIIPNAKDAWTDIPRREVDIQKEKEDLINIGLQPEELDLRHYFGNQNILATKLSEYGSIWVLGGNTFVLRRAFRESGLDVWLQNEKGNKDFVYAGYSAGICILSPELKGLEMIDEPYVVPRGYKPEIIWEGLGFVDCMFAPHFQSNHPESEAVGRLVEHLTINSIKFKALHDGEGFIAEIGD